MALPCDVSGEVYAVRQWQGCGRVQPALHVHQRYHSALAQHAQMRGLTRLFDELRDIGLGMFEYVEPRGSHHT